MIRAARFALLFAACTVALGGAEEVPHDVYIDCVSLGQLCEPPAVVIAETESTLQARFEVHPSHCSSIRVQYSVDGVPTATTEWLGYSGDPEGRPLVSETLDLGPVPSGTHEVQLMAEGQVGGCNVGRLIEWGGTVYLTVSGPVSIEAASWGSVRAAYR
jgi:hypothetical protein